MVFLCVWLRYQLHITGQSKEATIILKHNVSQGKCWLVHTVYSKEEQMQKTKHQQHLSHLDIIMHSLT